MKQLKSIIEALFVVGLFLLFYGAVMGAKYYLDKIITEGVL